MFGSGISGLIILLVVLVILAAIIAGAVWAIRAICLFAISARDRLGQPQPPEQLPTAKRAPPNP